MRYLENYLHELCENLPALSVYIKFNAEIAETDAETADTEQRKKHRTAFPIPCFHTN